MKIKVLPAFIPRSDFTKMENPLNSNNRIKYRINHAPGLNRNNSSLGFTRSKDSSSTIQNNNFFLAQQNSSPDFKLNINGVKHVTSFQQMKLASATQITPRKVTKQSGREQKPPPLSISNSSNTQDSSSHRSHPNSLSSNIPSNSASNYDAARSSSEFITNALARTNSALHKRRIPSCVETERDLVLEISRNNRNHQTSNILKTPAKNNIRNSVTGTPPSIECSTASSQSSSGSVPESHNNFLTKGTHNSCFPGIVSKSVSSIVATSVKNLNNTQAQSAEIARSPSQQELTELTSLLAELSNIVSTRLSLTFL